MIDYTCPKCAAPMRSPDSLVGQPDTCPACGASAVVPQTATVVYLSRRSIIIAAIVFVGIITASLAWGFSRRGGGSDDASATMGDAVRARNVIGVACRWSGPPDGSAPMWFFLTARAERPFASVEGFIEVWHYGGCIAVIPVTHDIDPASSFVSYHVSPRISREARRILAGDPGLRVIFVATRIEYADGDVEIFPASVEPDRALAAQAYVMDDDPGWGAGRRFRGEHMFRVWCFGAGTPGAPGPLEFMMTNGSSHLTTAAIKGDILVYDQHGDCVAVIPVAYDKPLELGETVTFEIDWYVDARTRDLLVGNISGCRLVFAVSSVIYADGSREIFGE